MLRMPGWGSVWPGPDNTWMSDIGEPPDGSGQGRPAGSHAPLLEGITRIVAKGCAGRPAPCSRALGAVPRFISLRARSGLVDHVPRDVFGSSWSMWRRKPSDDDGRNVLGTPQVPALASCAGRNDDLYFRHPPGS